MIADDLAVLVAIQSEGAFTRAARRLGVAHTTVARRLRELEEHFGAKLVERAADRAVLTAEGERAALAAGRISDELLELERCIKGRDGRLSGRISLTTVDILAVRYMPRLAAFCAANPGIELAVSAETEVRSLSRREAEMALRLTNAPEEHLFGRIVERFDFAPYANVSTAERLKAPEALRRAPWVDYSERDCAAKSVRWMKRNAPDADVRARVGTPLLMLQAVTAGIGAGLLPTVVADEHEELRRIGDEAAFSLDVWLLAPSELKDTARIRAVFEAFAGARRKAA